MSEEGGKMIRGFYGDDRVKAGQEIKKFLGENYEVVEGENLMPGDLPSLFMGGSLFDEERAILVRDILANKAVSEKIVDYVETPHKIVFLETKLDKRLAAYKDLKDRVEFKEFKLPENADYKLVFDIYKVAKRDGKKAVEMLAKIQEGQEPMMFTGLMASQAIRDFVAHPGAKEKRVLHELSKLDMNLKSSKLPSWLLVQAFLLQLASW